MPRNPRPRPSPLEEALARVGDRWTLLTVDSLLRGPKRFKDLLRDLSGIAPNILSERLRRLEKEAVIVARPYSSRPPRFVYELSADGLDLAATLKLLGDWGARRSGTESALRHSVCGTHMEARWYCSTCALPVEEGDMTELEFL